MKRLETEISNRQTMHSFENNRVCYEVETSQTQNDYFSIFLKI